MSEAFDWVIEHDYLYSFNVFTYIFAVISLAKAAKLHIWLGKYFRDVFLWSVKGYMRRIS